MWKFEINFSRAQHNFSINFNLIHHRPDKHFFFVLPPLHFIHHLTSIYHTDEYEYEPSASVCAMCFWVFLSRCCYIRVYQARVSTMFELKMINCCVKIFKYTQHSVQFTQNSSSSFIRWTERCWEQKKYWNAIGEVSVRQKCEDFFFLVKWMKFIAFAEKNVKREHRINKFSIVIHTLNVGSGKVLWYSDASSFLLFYPVNMKNLKNLSWAWKTNFS